MTRHTNLSTYSMPDGFTLVELLLALAFVGFLLIFILTATIEVVGDYTKGVTIKEINQSARTTLEGMTTVAASTSVGKINLSAIANNRVCFGSVSYVWNTTNATVNKYTNGSVVGLARVDDPGGTMCIKVGGNYPNVTSSAATSLITNLIWVQKFTVALTTDQELVTIDLRLSTSGIYAPTYSSPSGKVCGGGTSGNYCAVSEFITSVNASNI